MLNFHQICEFLFCATYDMIYMQAKRYGRFRRKEVFDSMQSIRTPKYEKIAGAIRKDIGLGNYPVGSFLPPEPKLEAKYQVSRATVRSAIQLLVKEGLLTVRQGQGTKVLHSASLHRFESVTSLSESYSFAKPDEEYNVNIIVNIDEIPIPNRDDAEFLQIQYHAPVFRIQRFLLRNGTPYSILTNYLPKYLVPNLMDYKGKFVDLYSFLKETCGIQYTKAEETVSAQCAGLIESEILNIPVNTPLLFLRRTAYCNLGPLECSYQQICTDVYKLHIHMNNE